MSHDVVTRERNVESWAVRRRAKARGRRTTGLEEEVRRGMGGKLGSEVGKGGRGGLEGLKRLRS